jgi:hypothetical protein
VRGGQHPGLRRCALVLRVRIVLIGIPDQRTIVAGLGAVHPRRRPREQPPSRTRVDKAGTAYVNPATSPEKRELALAVINNWRSSHAFPLNTLQVSLRTRARHVDPDALVAQRIKRLPSIRANLERIPGMSLSRMQDTGGCRAVVQSVDEVAALFEKYRSGNGRHADVRCDDYLFDQPKPSGYRGIHLVYSYKSDRKATFNGLRIEVQLRSRLQHAWATAVETVGTFTRQALKSSQGAEDSLQFSH